MHQKISVLVALGEALEAIALMRLSLFVSARGI
jgi:hypothetical protein